MRRLPVGLLLLACALPARAGLFDDDVARARIEKIQSAVDALAQQTELAARNQMDFANHIESLRAELAKVTGLLEELSYRIDAAEKRQRDFYVDLDNRLRKLEQPTGDAPAAEVKPADPAQETRDYEAALAAVKSAKYEEALSAFGTFVKNHPSSGLLASAYFWSGYCLMQTRKPAKAAEMYGKLVATWPEDSRAPDALAAQAAALEAAGDKAGAKKALETLRQKYPDSEAAKSQRTARKK